MRPAPPRFPVFRRPSPRAVLVVAVALLTGVVVHRTTAEAEATAARYGLRSTVAVVSRDLAAGDTVRPGDVALLERPVALVPDDAVTDDPTGRVVRDDVVTGEVLVARRLADADRSGTTALVPAGWRAMAIPVVDAPLPVSRGDHVDVVASFDPSMADGQPSQVVAEGAVVVDVSDDALTVAVPRRDVTRVAFALANGIVTLALVG